MLCSSCHQWSYRCLCYTVLNKINDETNKHKKPKLTLEHVMTICKNGNLSDSKFDFDYRIIADDVYENIHSQNNEEFDSLSKKKALERIFEFLKLVREIAVYSFLSHLIQPRHQFSRFKAIIESFFISVAVLGLGFLILKRDYVLSVITQ